MADNPSLYLFTSSIILFGILHFAVAFDRLRQRP